MKLFASTYVSPSDNEGTFSNVYIEDTFFGIKRLKNALSVGFSMYVVKNENKVILAESQLEFWGMNSEIDKSKPFATSNRTMTISIPNPDYDSIAASIPTTVQTLNPSYDPNDENSHMYIDAPNPNFDSLVAQVNKRLIIPALEYLNTHEGLWPEDYQMEDWGKPTYEDAVGYFQGGSTESPEVTSSNELMKSWLLNSVMMKGEIIGKQFNFIE